MRIGSPIQAYVNGSVQSQDSARQDALRQAGREQEKARQSAASFTIDQDVQISDAARRAAQQREVVATERSDKSYRGYQVYPFPENVDLSLSQQRALQAYASNQQMSRTDGSGEFLGSIDIFA